MAVMLEDAKSKMTESVNRVIQETGLPAYLIDGILSSILADVRNQKNTELLVEMKNASGKQGQKKKEEGAE